MNERIRSLLSDWPRRFDVRRTHIQHVTVSSFDGERFLICDHSRPHGQHVVAGSVTAEEAASAIESLAEEHAVRDRLSPVA